MDEQQMSTAEMDENIFSAAADRADLPASDARSEISFRGWEPEIFWPVRLHVNDAPADELRA